MWMVIQEGAIVTIDSLDQMAMPVVVEWSTLQEKQTEKHCRLKFGKTAVGKSG
jgi:hypothetical protein